MCIQVKRQNKKNSSRSSSPRLGTVAPPTDIGFILLRRTKACRVLKGPVCDVPKYLLEESGMYSTACASIK